jgi:alcohol dehydrogenase
MISFRGALLRKRGLPAPYSESRPLEIVDLVLPKPGRGEVLVEVRAASLCRSDLSVVTGARVWPLPMVIGHEAAGRVVAVGPEVERVGPGDEVVLVYLPQCGACVRCRGGQPWLCEAGGAANRRGELLTGGTRLRHGTEDVYHHMGLAAFAEYALVAEQSVVKIPSGLPPADMCVFGCAVLCGSGSAINTSGMGKGDAVAVIGLGAVGLSAVLGSRAVGAASVVAIDRLDSKLEPARKVGADSVHSPASALEAGLEVDHVIEASGSLEGFELAMRLVRRGGVVTTLGLPGPGAAHSLELAPLVVNGVSIKGSYLGSCDVAIDVPRFVDWYRNSMLDVSALVSHHVGLEDINEALDRLAAGEALRQVIETKT